MDRAYIFKVSNSIFQTRECQKLSADKKGDTLGKLTSTDFLKMNLSLGVFSLLHAQ